MHAAGHDTVALCESDKFRQKILAHHFPGLPIFPDVVTLAENCDAVDGTIPQADVVFGGPPCQNTSKSSAIHGYRNGRSLWPHMHRIGLHLQAEWIIVEQPIGNAAWEATIEADLSRSGYHVARFEFGAHDIGAPYIRRRVYLVACTSLSRLQIAWEAGPSAIAAVKRAADARGTWDPASIPTFGMATWRDEPVDQRRRQIIACGDSNPPQMAEVIGLMLRSTDHHVVRSRATVD